jgi:glycosyltransferase involved in cell wall biosynthesis
MRVALFSECYLPVTNGVVTSIITLREALHAQGHRVYVFAPGAPQPEDDPDVYRLPELPFPRHPYHLARPFPRLSFDFRALDVDIVHCQHPFTVGGLGADIAHRYGIPMVYTAHSLYDTMAAVAKSPIVRSVAPAAARGVVKRFCAKADYVIAPTFYTREWLRAGGVDARFAVVPSGVYTPQAPEGARERLRADLGLRGNEPVILYVGRLGPEKRLDLLLNAAAQLASRNLPAESRDFRVVIVGDGPERSELDLLTDDLNLRSRVVFAGHQPHCSVGEWYAAADIFALASPFETQGMVLAEAMACGLPCVAIDRGGAREVVLHNETGFLVPFEVDAFATALEKILADPDERQRMSVNGLERARSYTPEAMAKGVLEVYEAAIRVPLLPTRTNAGLARLRTDLIRNRRTRVKFRPLRRLTVASRMKQPKRRKTDFTDLHD